MCKSQLRSKVYVDVFLKGKDSIYDTHVLLTSGYISGKVKIVVTLRLPSGDFKYDIVVIFDIEDRHCPNLCYEVLLDWIIKPNIGNIDMIKYLCDEYAMAKVSKSFAKRSYGRLKGVIKALDGWRLDSIQKSCYFLFKEGV